MRYPALVLSLAWCLAVTGGVVLLPMQPALGIAALALAVLCLAAAVVVRPAIVALSLAVALVAVARVELPVADPQVQVHAQQLAGDTATILGTVADDSTPAANGGQVVIEPTAVIVGPTSTGGVGNVIVRWRGPSQVGFGDHVQATGRLVLPRDLPTFGRRAYLAQRDVYLQLDATTFDVVSTGAGLAALPAWIRAWFTAGLSSAMPPPHSAVLLGIVLGVKQGIPAQLQQALIATGLVHLLVLSGLKVAVFARIVQGALHPLLGGRPRRRRSCSSRSMR